MDLSINYDPGMIMQQSQTLSIDLGGDANKAVGEKWGVLSTLLLLLRGLGSVSLIKIHRCWPHQAGFERRVVMLPLALIGSLKDVGKPKKNVMLLDYAVIR